MAVPSQQPRGWNAFDISLDGLYANQYFLVADVVTGEMVRVNADDVFEYVTGKPAVAKIQTLSDGRVFSQSDSGKTFVYNSANATSVDLSTTSAGFQAKFVQLGEGAINFSNTTSLAGEAPISKGIGAVVHYLRVDANNSVVSGDIFAPG